MFNKLKNLFSKKPVKETLIEEKKKLSYKEKVEKGRRYELQVIEYFEMNGYSIEHRGATKKKKDKGIDILAKRENIYYLIQCKNYAPTTKIKHNLIKEFNSNCLDFINSNKNKLNRENTKFVFAIAHRESLEKCAIHYLKDTNNKCEFMEIKYIEELIEEAEKTHLI